MLICTRCRANIPDESIYCNICGKKQPKAAVKPPRRAKLSGGISFLGSNRKKPYSVRYCGKYLGTYATRAEAERALAAVTPKSLGRLTVTFKEYYKTWAPQYFKNKSLSEKSIKSLENSFRKLYPLHNMKLCDITAQDISAAINSDFKTNSKGDNLGELSVSAKRKHLYLVNQLFIGAQGARLASENPASAVSIISKSEAQEKTVFTVEQINLIRALAYTPYPPEPSGDYEEKLEYIRRRNNIFAARVTLVLILTGLRINELLNIRLADCENGFLRGGLKTKAGKNRIIPVHRYIKDIIAEWQSQNKIYLVESFNHSKKNDKHFREKEYYPMLEALGIEPPQTVTDGEKSKRIHTPHTCRHTFATLADNANLNAKVVNLVIGHTDEEMRRRVYVHKNLLDIANEVNKISI